MALFQFLAGWGDLLGSLIYLIVLFFLAQRTFIQGITLTGVKG